jgi:hypothetical protein
MTTKEETNPVNRTARTFEDVKINVRLKLSALWVAVTFLYVYADIRAFLSRGS